MGSYSRARGGRLGGNFHSPLCTSPGGFCAQGTCAQKQRAGLNLRANEGRESDRKNEGRTTRLQVEVYRRNVFIMCKFSVFFLMCKFFSQALCCNNFRPVVYFFQRFWRSRRGKLKQPNWRIRLRHRRRFRS